MAEWASEQLLEFLAVYYGVSVEKITPLSKFSVKSILTKYMADNKITGTYEGIRCDDVLQKLFYGRREISHYEMFEFVNSHFKVLQEYAAIDENNISLMYLNRNMILSLKDDDTFYEKATGSFVKIRNLTMGVNELLPVKRINKKNVVPYKVKNIDIDFHLGLIVNGNKMSISINRILEDEFVTDAELERLQNMITNKIIDLPTVDFIHKKALALQPARAICWQSVEMSKWHNNPNPAKLEEIRETYERMRTDIHEVHIDPRIVSL